MNGSNPRSMQAIVLGVISVGLIALALGGYLTPLSRIVLSPFISAQTWISTRFQAINDLINSPSDMTQLRQRNAELEAEVARLHTEIIRLEDQAKEVEVLSALVDFATANPQAKYLGANVIAYDPSPFMSYVIINRGSDDGLRRGMPVVTSQGLVGRVAAVNPVASRVQLLIDPGSYINVRMQSTDSEGVLSGEITGEIVLENLPQDEVVQTGDLVLTSGLGGSFPPDIIVGQVTGVRQHDYDLFQSATVQPVVDFASLEIVLVIVNFRPVDISPLLP
jgi:rod shape-determining protein MreC